MGTLADGGVLTLPAGPSAAGVRAAPSHAVVDTGGSKCYDNRDSIATPGPRPPFYDQDAQFHHHLSSDTLGAVGWTVQDNSTGRIGRGAAMYVGFGRPGGWMSARAMAGDPGMFPRSRGPRGEVIRIHNHVRLVRNDHE